MEIFETLEITKYIFMENCETSESSEIQENTETCETPEINEIQENKTRTFEMQPWNMLMMRESMKNCETFETLKNLYTETGETSGIIETQENTTRTIEMQPLNVLMLRVMTRVKRISEKQLANELMIWMMKKSIQP